jgi:DNA-binding SARP family transcriptional activator
VNAGYLWGKTGLIPERDHTAGNDVIFRILGQVQVTSAGGEPVPLTQQAHRAALAALLLRAGQVCPRSWLLTAIWGTRPPASGTSALRTAMYGLRRELGPLGSRIRTRQSGPRPGGYLVQAADGEVDVRLFRALTAAGHRAWYQGDARRAARELGEALSLWRDGPSELLSGPAVAPEVERLQAEFSSAQDTWMDARLALGEHHEAAPELRRILAREPLREHAWAQLMLALYRSGDKTGAGNAFCSARAALKAEYGCAPGPELAELHRQLLSDNPALSTGGRTPALA